MNSKGEKFGTIGILMGGYSSEREISLKSGKAIYEALLAEGCRVVAIDIVETDESQIIETIRRQKIDVAFIALHGRLGEDGTIQHILESLAIPYTGSQEAASRIAYDKGLTQRLLQNNGITVAPFRILNKNQTLDLKSLAKELGGFPVVVKPTCEGSSIGVTIVGHENELGKALDLAWKYGDSVIIERFIKGREMTVGIFNDEPLAVVEVCPQKTFFDFEAKYKSGLTDYKVPAQLPTVVASLLQQIALKVYKLIGCRHLARIDFILSEDQKPFLLEINTIPGFTSTSLLPKAAKVNGISFNELCLSLVELAYGSKKESSKTVIPC